MSRRISSVHTAFRIFLPLILCLPLTTMAQSDDAEKRQAMNAAYRQYQEAVAQGPQFREQAIAPARQAYELALEVLGDADPTTAALAINYGNSLSDGDEAARILEQALKITENANGKDALELVDPLMALANSATNHSKFADARRHYTRALDIVKKQEEKDPFLEAVIGIQLGTTSFSMDRMSEAGNYFKAARDALAPINNDIARVQLASANFWIGRYEINQENYADATTALVSSLETLSRYPEAAPLAFNNHIALVEAYEKQGRHAEATPHLVALASEGKQPVPVYQVRAVNPSRRTQGQVRVSFVVDAQGYAREPQLVAAEIDNPDDYFKASTDALEQFRFTPRISNGQPVVSDRMEHVFQFQAGR